GAADAGVLLGTTGGGLHVSVPVHHKLSVRTSVNALPDLREERSAGTLAYTSRRNIRTAELLLDWHPWGNMFRVSTGLVINGNHVAAVARPDPDLSYRIGGREYDVLEVGEVRGRVDFNRLAPFIGVGLTTPPSQYGGWSVAVDIGVFYQGHARSARLWAPDCRVEVPGLCEQLNVDLLDEVPRLRGELPDLRFFPVIRAGLFYRF
ncbi:MAG TPA: hypothetical protein VM406_10530, partial [Noviherbaspirillum sp.]|nr:hypothetical protein [Noviherbaspirillum sp.]